MRIDISQLYIAAESLGEKFDDVRIITLKEEAKRLVLEESTPLDDIDRYPTVWECVEITADNISVIIDVPYIDAAAEEEVVRRVAIALRGLSEGRGRMLFSGPKRYTMLDMITVTH
jgi:hypothetical protein